MNSLEPVSLAFLQYWGPGEQKALYSFRLDWRFLQKTIWQLGFPCIDDSGRSGAESPNPWNFRAWFLELSSYDPAFSLAWILLYSLCFEWPLRLDIVLGYSEPKTCPWVIWGLHGDEQLMSTLHGGWEGQIHSTCSLTVVMLPDLQLPHGLPLCIKVSFPDLTFRVSL